MSPSKKRESVLVMGIGNELRGDDAAGLLVARGLLSEKVPSFVTILEMRGDGASFMARWKNINRLILVDAITAGLPPGSVIRMDARKEIVPASLFATSSHSFGLAQAVAISLALDELPASVTLYGIQAGNFQMGTEMTPGVQRAIQETIAAIRCELAGMTLAADRRARATLTTLKSE